MFQINCHKNRIINEDFKILWNIGTETSIWDNFQFCPNIKLKFKFFIQNFIKMGK